ncbi:MAG: YceI family protein [Maricaulis sp.]|nr:YceI family protein [Maricaulis sp.]MBO6764410.1 YceI family protein [Maricaulis sp.]
MRRFRHALLPAALVLAACAQPAAQGNDWQLDRETSSVGFVSIKSGEIAEAHHFTNLTGSVAEDGTAELLIALDSVETGIEIRNERMREHFFQTGEYPQARLTAQIDLAALTGL